MPLRAGNDADQPLPDGPMKEDCFEVIAGRSVVAFRRAEGEEVPPVKCFAFVQTFDQKPRRRLWELMKSQGMPQNQQMVFLSEAARTFGVCRSSCTPTASI